MDFISRSFAYKVAASLAVFAVIVGISFQLPLTPPSVFQVEARIWIQQKLTAEATGHQSASLLQSFMTYFNSPILTACEVLKSTLVCEEALND